jgi:hypothetical protein
VEFKVVERMMLLNLLAGAEGDVTMLRIVRDAQGKLGFREEELEALNIRQEGSQAMWNATADRPVEIDIGRAAQKLITEKLGRLNAEKRLTLVQLDLYERFCPEDVEEDAEVR